MQRENFRAVHSILHYFGPKWGFDAEKALDSLKESRWPGRCQQLSSDLIIDGGHNPDGVSAFTAALEELYPGVKHQLIYAAFRDKDFKSCVKILSRVAERFIFLPVPAAERPTASKEELTALAEELRIPCTCVSDAGAALKLARAARAPGSPVVVSGSLYLIGDVLRREVPLQQVLDL